MKQAGLQITQNVRMDGDCVLKKVTCGLAQVKLMQAAHALSNETQSFYVPKVLDYDKKTETMKIEYLPDLVSLKQYFHEHKEIARILYCVGDALACCHDRLTVSEEDRIEALMPWAGLQRDQVVLHGDFNMVNLCYSQEMGRLVILDWEASPALPFQCNWGSRYLDIVQFVRSLLLQQESLKQGMFGFRKRVKVFLTAYQQTSGIHLDMRRLRRRLYDYNVAVMKKQLSQHKYLSGLHSILGSWVFQANLRAMNIKKLSKLTSYCGISEQTTGGIHG